MSDDSIQKMLGRIEAEQRHHSEDAAEIKDKITCLDEKVAGLDDRFNDLSLVVRDQGRMIKEHQELDTKVAAQITADLEPLKRHVNAFNGVVKGALVVITTTGTIAGVIVAGLKIVEYFR